MRIHPINREKYLHGEYYHLCHKLGCCPDQFLWIDYLLQLNYIKLKAETIGQQVGFHTFEIHSKTISAVVLIGDHVIK